MRNNIIKSALAQVKRFGFRRFTIDEIASDLGISKKTIYKYFDSKSELISAAVDSQIESEKRSTIEAMNANVAWLDKFEKIIFSDNCAEKPQDRLIEELQRFFPEEWSKVENMREFKSQQLKKILEEGRRKGDISETVHIETVVMLLESTIDKLLDLNFVRQHGLTLQSAIREVKQIILYGILNGQK